MLRGTCKPELVAAELPPYGLGTGSAHEEQECTCLEATALRQHLLRKLTGRKVCTQVSAQMRSVIHWDMHFNNSQVVFE